MSKNYNVHMSGDADDNSVTIRIPDIDADFGPSSTGKSDKVAYGVVYFQDSNRRTVTVQVNAYRRK